MNLLWRPLGTYAHLELTTSATLQLKAQKTRKPYTDSATSEIQLHDHLTPPYMTVSLYIITYITTNAKFLCTWHVIGEEWYQSYVTDLENWLSHHMGIRIWQQQYVMTSKPISGHSQNRLNAIITFDLQPLMMLVEPEEDGSVTSLWVAPRQLPAKAQLRRASPWTRYGAPNLANHLLLHIPIFLSATWQFFYWFKHLLNPTWQNKLTDHLISSHGSEAVRDGISMTPEENEVIELQHLITNGWFHHRRLMSNLTTNIPP